MYIILYTSIMHTYNLIVLCNSHISLIKYNTDHGWDLTLKSLFPDETDLERADVLDFGVGHDHLMNILLHDHGGSPIPDKGIQSLTMVLHAARDSLGVEFCPLLPDVACLLLSYMPVSIIVLDNCIFMYVLS